MGDYGQFGGSNDGMTFEIAQEHVGRVIGRGGSKIRELQDESGCRIKITRDGPPCVQLFGNPEQCAVAKQLIQDFTSSLPDSRGGGYGGGGYRGRGGGGYGYGGRGGYQGGY